MPGVERTYSSLIKDKEMFIFSRQTYRRNFLAKDLIADWILPLLFVSQLLEF